MKYKIGIYGSAEDNFEKNTNIAKELGRQLGNHASELILLTGASTGLPYLVVSEAYKKGVEIWGYSPAVDLKNQKKLSPQENQSIYKKLIYTPRNFEFIDNIQVCRKYRNVISTANCDAGIIISGRWGTLNEFTNLFDMNKIIGVLTGTGGITDELSSLCKKIRKKSEAVLLFDDSSKKLIDKILKRLIK